MVSTNPVSLKRLEEQLKCPVCLENYKEPKGLPCLHSFCRECLQRLPVERNEVHCPTCRQSNVLPQGGVAELPTAFHINTLLDLYNALQQPTISDSEVPVCVIHGKKREFYCQPCDEVVCSICAVRGHRTHVCDTAEVFYEPKKQEIETCLESLKEWITTIHNSIDDSYTEVTKVKDQASSVKVEICQFIEDTHQRLEMEKERLLTQLDTHMQQKLQQIAQKREGVETMLAQLNSCQEFVEDQLKTGSKEQVLAVRRQMIGHMKALTMHVDTSILLQSDSAIFFNANKSLYPLNVGDLCQLQFDQCLVSGTNRFLAQVDENLNFFINVKDIYANSENLPSCHTICCYPVTNPDASLSYSLERLEKGKYKVSFVLKQIGPHVVSIKVGDKHITESPFTCHVVSAPTMPLRSHIRTVENLKIPSGIAIRNDDCLIIGERDSYSITILSNTGERMLTFGNEIIQLSSGIALTDEGSILVVDTMFVRLLKFSRDGELEKSVGTSGNGPLQFNLPYSVAVHPNGCIFIADRGNNRIQVLNSDLTYSHCFGEKGKKLGQFLELFDIAIDPKGNVYTSDPQKGQVQKFTPSGDVLDSIQCKSPFYLCIDQQNILYIMEQRKPKREGFFLAPDIGVMHNHFITIVNCQKNMIHLGEFQWSENCPDYGCGGRIATDRHGFLYVCDPYEGLVYVC